eukprot:TRINITY_DN487_c0_g1_i6.p1 TRINITY_DN487_c0_g1~~TRINITY_DN487_c0_g1_i6.p1  ORF type:complete len:195 (-),score=-1.74 TRINITY_DN487_c0_g1_i6:175-759(-)
MGKIGLPPTQVSRFLPFDRTLQGTPSEPTFALKEGGISLHLSCFSCLLYYVQSEVRTIEQILFKYSRRTNFSSKYSNYFQNISHGFVVSAVSYPQPQNTFVKFFTHPSFPLTLVSPKFIKTHIHTQQLAKQEKSSIQLQLWQFYSWDYCAFVIVSSQVRVQENTKDRIVKETKKQYNTLSQQVISIILFIFWQF